MNASQLQVLRQAERAKAVNQPYRPSEAWLLATDACVRDGLVDRRQTGGFALNSDGERALAASRQRA